MTVNRAIEKQYNDWVYPEPVTDLDAWKEQGYFQESDPKYVKYLYWQDKERDELEILVAGCGAFQAAAIAYNNPNSFITGIDVSDNSLNKTRELVSKHNIKNIDLKKISIFELGALEKKFDLIICTGVLHHLPDPIAGGQELVKILKKDGLMFLMLYGKYLRTGVYMLQDVFRTLGLKQTQKDVDFVRSVLNELDQNHPAQKYIHHAKEDLRYDGGVVDTFLNPQDKSYTVGEVYDFADAIGMKFQCWPDNITYSPKANFSPDHPAMDRLMNLSPRSRAECVEGLCQNIGRHSFILCHDDSRFRSLSDDVGNNEFYNYVPHHHPATIIKRTGDFNNGVCPVLSQNGNSITLSYGAACLYDAVDGERNIGECIDFVAKKHNVEKDVVDKAAKDFFGDMFDWGHMHFQYPE